MQTISFEEEKPQQEEYEISRLHSKILEIQKIPSKKNSSEYTDLLHRYTTLLRRYDDKPNIHKSYKRNVKFSPILKRYSKPIHNIIPAKKILKNWSAYADGGKKSKKSKKSKQSRKFRKSRKFRR